MLCNLQEQHKQDLYNPFAYLLVILRTELNCLQLPAELLNHSDASILQEASFIAIFLIQTEWKRFSKLTGSCTLKQKGSTFPVQEMYPTCHLQLKQAVGTQWSAIKQNMPVH